MIDFKSTEMTLEQKYNLAVSALKEQQCVINFTKVNGEERNMVCTLQDVHMPAAGQMLLEEIADTSVNHNIVTVWCLENQAWRSMRTENINYIRPHNKWTLTIEEDPETGDIMIPFPEDFLTTVGWETGDIINWTQGENDAWILTKSSATPSE